MRLKTDFERKAYFQLIGLGADDDPMTPEHIGALASRKGPFPDRANDLPHREIEALKRILDRFPFGRFSIERDRRSLQLLNQRQPVGQPPRRLNGWHFRSGYGNTISLQQIQLGSRRPYRLAHREWPNQCRDLIQ